MSPPVQLAVAMLFALVSGSSGSVRQAPPSPETQEDARGTRPASTVTPRRQAYARRHALVVGIDQYRDPGFADLRNAVADARAVAELLVKRYGFEPGETRLLADEQATRAALARALEDWLSDPSAIGPDDLVVVYFAGHGVTQPLGESGSRGYLVPVDGEQGERGNPRWSTLLGMEALEDSSVAIPAKHVLFVLDCCFGGLAILRGAQPILAGLDARARQVITAGDANQTVSDAGSGQQHSVFTAAFLKALGGEADRDGDGSVAFGELYEYVAPEVGRATEMRQTPLQANLPDHRGGNVAFFPPDLTLQAPSVQDRLRQLERTSEQQLAELKRLADALDATELLREETLLWPAFPDRAPALRDWLSRARRLHERLGQHRDSVERVRQEAFLKQVQAGNVKEAASGEPDWPSTEPELRWRHETFVRLVQDIEAVARLQLELEARLHEAETIRERSIDRHRTQWDAARSAVGKHPRFRGLTLEPQLGLVPLGPDPRSTLWEFAAVQTGSVPERDSDGVLALTGDSALVFVLLPGGRFVMGSQGTDRKEPVYDPNHFSDEAPPHTIELAPFFLAKHELTQGQWMRCTGTNPSYYLPGSIFIEGHLAELHPVEQISWTESETTLARFGFVLPTEAQWEYGCRAGTTTPWWTGFERESLTGAANLADAAARRGGALWDSIRDWPDFDDGHMVHAPVDTLAPNPFGLHHVHGNVWEWCRDGHAPYAETIDLPGAIRAGDGEHVLANPANRVFRGGSYWVASRHARSSNRSPHPVGYRAADTGVRPARTLDGRPR